MVCFTGTGRSAVRFAGWSAALLLAWGLSGCQNGKDSVNPKPSGRAATFENEKTSEPTTIMKNQTTKVPVKRLIVSKPNNAGRPVQLGSLEFDESNRASLSTEGSGPAVDELKRVWDEVSKMGKLTWTQSRQDTIDGEKVTRIVDVEAKAGDKIYIYAVLDTLERKYGYTVDIAK
jgi:hypothetical protein